MSYIQGTRVRLQADFTDNETREPTDPTEVILRIKAPDGVITQKTLSADEVIDDDDAVGRFYYVLDTPLVGTYQYEFASTGNEATVGKKEITVRPRIS